MRKCIALLDVAVLLVGLSGCALPRVPVQPPPGVLFSHYRAPLSTDYKDTAVAGKTGEASTFFIWEPIFDTTWAWDDASIQTAASRAGITKIAYADYEAFSVLSMFGKFKVIVHGE